MVYIQMEKNKNMIIRKLFKFEGAHIVRNCSTKRCSENIHGHSYIVEVFLESDMMDNGQMVVDFGLLKGTVKDIIDSFDHSYSLWNKEKPEFKKFIKENNTRWVEMPVSPSAEMYSLMFYALINFIMANTQYNNGERGVTVHSVRVHETATGYAESFYKDWENLWFNKWGLRDITFSQGVKDEWKDPEMWDKLLSSVFYDNEPGKIFINEKAKITHE